MTAKVAKSRNSDRRSGKAWGKSHDAPVKVLSPEAQARKALREAERKDALIPPLERSRVGRGSNITMPKITWEWATNIMASRFPNTRRAVMVELCIAQEKARPIDDSPLVVELNPEARATKSSRKNGR